MAIFLLKEKTPLFILMGIGISLVGVITIIHPKFDGVLSPGFYVGVASGILMALAQVILRRLAKVGEPTDRIVFYLYSTATLFSVLIIFIENMVGHHNLVKAITNQHGIYVFSMLIALGLVSLFAQSILTVAFRYMAAAKLAPFLYISIPMSGFIGWIIWRQELTVNFFIGAVLILTGTILIMIEQIKEARCVRTPVSSL